MKKTIVIIATALFQTVGPICVGFDRWANILQYLGGFGIPLAVFHFYHKMKHLHDKHDQLLKEVSERGR